MDTMTDAALRVVVEAQADRIRDLVTENAKLLEYCRIKDAKIVRLREQVVKRGQLIFERDRACGKMVRQLGPMREKLNKQKNLIRGLFAALKYYEDVETWPEWREYHARTEPADLVPGGDSAAQAAAELPAVRA